MTLEVVTGARLRLAPVTLPASHLKIDIHYILYIMYHYHRGSDHGSSTSGSTWRTHTFLPLGLVLVLIYVNRNEIS